MKKVFINLVFIAITIIVIINYDYISDKFVTLLTPSIPLNIEKPNIYKKDDKYLFANNTDNLSPLGFQDLLDIFYTIINGGYKNFTFYCPTEYKECQSDINDISNDEEILMHINNYVHPYNSFTSIKTLISDNGEININVEYLYTEDEIIAVNKKIDEIISKEIKSDMDEYEKLKVLHDYLVNNSKYDTLRNNQGTSSYKSFNAYGVLLEGYGTCNGYTDAYAIMLNKLGINNIKVSTTKDEISYASTGHVWNGIYHNNEWVHTDITWDDPVASDGKDYLYHKYFLIDNEDLVKIDNSGKTKLEEHNFNKTVYLEFNY